MAVDKMKLITVVGPLESMDQLSKSNIINNEIHLEDSITVLENVEGLNNFKVENPYGDHFKKITDIILKSGINTKNLADNIKLLDTHGAIVYINAISQMLDAISAHRDELKKSIAENQAVIEQISPLSGMNIRLGKLFDLKFVRIKFGKLPKTSFNKLVTYLTDMDAIAYRWKHGKDTLFGISDVPAIELNNVSALFCPFKEDDKFVFGVIFIPTVIHKKIDAIFSSLHFERVVISGNIKDTPAEAIEKLKIDIERNNRMLSKLDVEEKRLIETEKNKLLSAYKTIKYAHKINEVRKYAASTEKSFCITAWVPEKAVPDFATQFSEESHITVLSENPKNIHSIDPPTRLSNHGIFKPFEEFIKMYGLPAYNEVDPTKIMAVIYTVLFGIMYGDVGHGLVLLIVALFMRKKNFLGKAFIPISISAMIFGFLYGEVFGYTVFNFSFTFRPLHNINNILMFAIGLGIVCIVIAMSLNITNKIKQGEGLKSLFDSNGIAGVVFYIGIIVFLLNSFAHFVNVNSTWQLLIFILVPLVLMFLRVPLTKLIDKLNARKGKIIHGEENHETMMESSFEMFEVLLSYATNTISFIRVGVFAISHASMMEAVFMMAQKASGQQNITIVIIGNIIVIALEALLVGIQVLRLELYELFSRFFSGTGREFVSQKEI